MGTAAPPPHEPPEVGASADAPSLQPSELPEAPRSLAARAWPLLLAAVVLMATVCGIWFALVGLAGAAASTGFQYLVVATLILGLVVAGRFTMRPLREGIGIDRRNVMDWSRSGLWKRRGRF